MSNPYYLLPGTHQADHPDLEVKAPPTDTKLDVAYYSDPLDGPTGEVLCQAYIYSDGVWHFDAHRMNPGLVTRWRVHVPVVPEAEAPYYLKHGAIHGGLRTIKEGVNEATYECIKCGAASGNDFSQCEGVCPVQGSPHYNPAWTVDNDGEPDAICLVDAARRRIYDFNVLHGMGMSAGVPPTISEYDELLSALSGDLGALSTAIIHIVSVAADAT